jgi:hypothetical protein
MVEGRDRLIAVRLAEWDLPVVVEDGVARTTFEGNEMFVLPTFDEVEGRSPAFLEWVRILDLLEGFEGRGLSWGVIGSHERADAEIAAYAAEVAALRALRALAEDDEG